LDTGVMTPLGGDLPVQFRRGHLRAVPNQEVPW